jgi:RDD family protein
MARLAVGLHRDPVLAGGPDRRGSGAADRPPAGTVLPARGGRRGRAAVHRAAGLGLPHRGRGRSARGRLGKRQAGLQVVAADGGRPGFGRVAVRNAVELLPWQLAHVAVARAILDPEDVGTMTVAYALSLLIPAGSIPMAWRDPEHRAAHDRLAGTRAVSAARA